MNFGDNVKSAHDMSPGLLRQRRNLVAVSLVLIFLELSNAKIHTFQLMGIHITFEQPEALFWMLFFSVLYLAYRYHLYLIQEPGPGLRDKYLELLNNYSQTKLLELSHNKFGKDEKFDIQEPLGTKRQSAATWRVILSFEHGPYGSSKTDYLDISVFDLWRQIIKASVVAVLTRSYFTDYVVPHILSGLAVVLCVVKLLKL